MQTVEKKEEYEQRFGRAYRSRFSAVLNVEETAEYLWELMGNFDSIAARFSEREGYSVCDCYFNIGCIMYTRERGLMMAEIFKMS